MQLLRHQPRAPLDAFIDCFWYSSGDMPQRGRELALPSGSADVVFNLQDDFIRTFADARDPVGTCARSAVVHGPQSRAFVLDARKQSRVIGVHFRPAGASLLGIPLKDLCDQHIELADLWGARAALLREELLEACAPQAMFAVLEQEFLRRLCRPLLVHPAISFSLRRFESYYAMPHVTAVREQTGYSERHFTTLFTDAVGLTPKLYGRVQRLGRVVNELARGRRYLAAIALDAGYHDQAHLNRDFRDLTGVTPGRYQPMAGRSVLHAQVDADRS